MKKKTRYVIVRHSFLQRESFLKITIFYKHETTLIYENETERNEVATKFRLKWIAKTICNFLNATNYDLLKQYEIREIKI